MYIQIGAEPDVAVYDKIRNLSFSPQVDLTNNSLPVNEYTVEVRTDDEIAGSQYAELYDDRDNLWARYWLHKVERVAPGLLRLYARSDIALMDDVTLDEAMYDGDSAEDVFEDTMLMSAGHGTGITGAIPYTLDATIAAMTVTGYCPEQTARERLQWLCLVLGAVVKTAFVDKITIAPLDDTPTIIPIEDTYARPTVSLADMVTSVGVTSYAFSRGSGSADDVLGDGTSYPFPLPWVADEERVELVNPEASPEYPDNAVDIDQVYLINSGNDDEVISRLSTRYFNREAISIEVINNALYAPGDRVAVYVSRDKMMSGTIETAEFQFGKQAKSRLTLVDTADVESAELAISYIWDGMVLALERRRLPVGYAYSVTTRYLDQTISGHRYIFRPTVATVTGTLTSEGAAVTVPCAVALDLYKGVLRVLDVDSVYEETETEDGETIHVGVIE